MKVRMILPALLIGLTILSGCSKSNSGLGNPTGGNNGTNGTTGTSAAGTGILYIHWATDGVDKINLQTNTKSTLFPENTGQYGYYVSNDGKTVLQSTSSPDNDYNANLYTITNISDGSIVTKFKYYPANGDITSPTLSPDGTMIAVPPTFDDGIVIMDLKGNVSHNLTSFQNNKIQILAWMPDETLLFTTSAGIFRTNQAFTQASLVKQVNFASWGNITASVDGTKIALSAGNHIWMMGADGSNMVQVTTSSTTETLPAFSPDGKHLLIGTNFRQSGPFGYLWDLAIIPADGNQYNVDKGADKNVIPVQPKGATIVQSGDGAMFWR
jgi:dipeptidyl aminopeptidase/acylaminoacyl peptidase